MIHCSLTHNTSEHAPHPTNLLAYKGAHWDNFDNNENIIKKKRDDFREDSEFGKVLSSLSVDFPLRD